MYKHKIWFLSMTLISAVLLICLLAIFFLSGLSPLKPNCLPISYPDGRVLDAEDGKVTTYITEKPFSEIIGFFEKSLQDSENNNRKWKKIQIGESATLFECASAATAYEAERGCIFLEEKEEGTVITSVWSHFPDSAPVCSYYIDALKAR